MIQAPEQGTLCPPATAMPLLLLEWPIVAPPTASRMIQAPEQGTLCPPATAMPLLLLEWPTWPRPPAAHRCSSLAAPPLCGATTVLAVLGAGLVWGLQQHRKHWSEGSCRVAANRKALLGLTKSCVAPCCALPTDKHKRICK
jgi:hypothetical protein